MSYSHIISRSYYVRPLTLWECLQKVRFHSWNISENESMLTINHFSPKNIELVKIPEQVTNLNFLQCINMKPCDGSPFYLLGLMAMFKSIKDIDKIFWGKYVIALDQGIKFPLPKDSNGFLAVDLSYKKMRRLTLVYEDAIWGSETFVLAEPIQLA